MSMMARLLERAAALFAELRKRRVFRAAGLYLVAAWAAIEVSSTVLPLLFVPEWVVRAVTVAAVLGFPVVLVLAWAFDLTPAGFQRAPASEPPIAPSKARTVLAGLTILATGAVGAVAWGVWLSPSAVASRTPPLDPSRVAVLYFDDHSQGGDLGHVADGVTEALIHELAQIEPLEVISRNGVKPFRDPTIPVDSIARILDVGSLVEGSVEGNAERLVATVQLIDGRTGVHVVSRRLERSGDDFLALRDAIVTEAARLLGQSLGRELDATEARAKTGSSEAWALVERSRGMVDLADTLRWRLGDVGAAQSVLRQADSLLVEAEGLDRDWAAPTLLRAKVAQNSARMATATRQGADSAGLRKAVALADRVLRNHPRNTEALAARGIALNRLSWIPGQPDSLVAAAERDLRVAVREDVDNAEAWVGLAELLRSRGDFGEASVAAERALDADPFLIHAEQSILFTLSHVWLELEDFERAARWAAEGRRRYPAEPAFAAEQLLIMAAWPEAPAPVDSAWTLVRAVERGYNMRQWPHGYLQAAAVLVRAGRPDSARAVVERVRNTAGGDPWLDYYEANVRLQLGDTDRAIRLLDRFVTAMPGRRAYIGQDWWWRPLRSDPRFRTLVDGG